MNVQAIKITILLLFVGFFTKAQNADEVPPGVYYRLNFLIGQDSVAKVDSLTNYYLNIDSNIGELYLIKAKLIEKAYTDSTKKLSISLDNTPKYNNFIPYRDNPSTTTSIAYPAKVFNEIEKNLIKAATLTTNNLMPEFELVRIYSLQLEAEKIKPLFKQVQQKISDSYIGLQFSNDIKNFFVQNQFEKGISVYQALSKVYPSRPGLLVEQAYFYLDEGNIAQAYTLSKKAYELEKNVYGTRDILIKMHIYHKKYSDANTLIYNSGINSYLFMLGLMEVNTKPEKWKGSLKSYIQIGQIIEHINISEMMVADTFAFDDKNYKLLQAYKPNEHIKLLLADAFNTPTAKLDYAEIMVKYGLVNNALDKLLTIEKPKKLSPEMMGKYYLLLAWCYQEDTQAKEVEKAYKKVTKIKLNNYETYTANLLLSEYYSKIGNTKKANKYSEKAAAIKTASTK